METSAGDRRAGPFVLRALLGAGGMGTVWRARDEILRRDVAIKLLPPHRASSAEARARMLREARAQAALAHPNVCTIYQAGEDGDNVWIAMELLPGPSLSERLRAGAIAAPQVVAWAVQIARALSAAHARGLVHRDLKPGNVMLDADRNVKVLDFGLVKILEAEAHGDESTASPAVETTLTRQGAVIGSPRYMSPEQASGAEIGPATDVFSLGVMMYELLTGVPPFTGATAMETLASIMRDRPRPLREIAPAVPTALASLVHACLAREAAQRPPIAAVVDALAAPMPPARPRRRWWIPAIALAAAAILAVVVATRGATAPTTSAPPTPTPTAGTTLLDRTLIIGASYDRAGRNLFLIVFDRVGRLFRSHDGGPPQPVPGLTDTWTITCCDHGRMVALTRDLIVTIDPDTLALGSAPDLDSMSHARSIALSPDGRWAVDLGKLGGMTLIDRSGRRPSPIRIRDEGRPFFGPHFSPDSEHLAYLRDTDKVATSELIVLDLAHDPEHPKVLGTIDSKVRRLSERIAWVAPDAVLALDERDDIPVWSRFTLAGARTVTELHDRVLEPVTSNGRAIAVVEHVDDSSICVADFAGGRLGTLAPVTRAEDRPTSLAGWLPDGRLVLSQRNRAARSIEIAALTIGGKTSTVLPADVGGYAQAQAIAGTDIVYVYNDPDDEHRSIGVTDDRGAAHRRLAQVGHGARVDCSSMLCVALVDREGGIELRELDPIHGGLGPPLAAGQTHPSFATIPAVSPDGKRFAYGGGTNVQIYDRKTQLVALRTAVGIGDVRSLAFDGDDLIVTDAWFAPGEYAIVRLREDWTTEVLVSDGYQYETPRIDAVHHRLAVLRRGFSDSIRIAPMSMLEK